MNGPIHVLVQPPKPVFRVDIKVPQGIKCFLHPVAWTCSDCPRMGVHLIDSDSRAQCANSMYLSHGRVLAEVLQLLKHLGVGQTEVVRLRQEAVVQYVEDKVRRAACSVAVQV